MIVAPTIDEVRAVDRRVALVFDQAGRAERRRLLDVERRMPWASPDDVLRAMSASASASASSAAAIGAPQWSPLRLGSTLYGWWEADQITGVADGATVQTFADASGRANDLSQVTAGNRMVYTASVAGLNGKPALLTLSGAVQRYMTRTTGLPSGTSAHTLIMVVRTVTVPVALTGFGGFGHTTAGAKNTSTIGHDAANTMWWGGDDQVAPTGGAIAAATSYVLSKTFSGGASGTVIGRRNGVQVATASSYTFGLTGGFVLGSYTGSVGGGCDAYVAACIACDSVLSASDLQTAEQHYVAKYGVTVA